MTLTSTPAGLHRNLRQRHVVFIGLAYMSPFAVFDTFGIVSTDDVDLLRDEPELSSTLASGFAFEFGSANISTARAASL